MTLLLLEKVLRGHGLHDPEESKKVPGPQTENNKYFNINVICDIIQTMPYNTKFDNESLSLLHITVQKLCPFMLPHAHCRGGDLELH